MESKPLGLRNIVVLVHGTWGRGVLFKKPIADWCEPSSSCAETIRSALGQETVIKPFAWSGANSPIARLEAARALEAKLTELRAEHPLAALHIVTHSHGGNVALYATKNISGEITTFTFFSVPFLVCRARDGSVQDPLNSVIRFAAILCFPILAANLFAATFLIIKIPSNASLIVEMGLAIINILILVVSMIPGLATLKWSMDFFAGKLTRQLKLVPEIDMANQISFKSLIVRAPGDEATEGIGVLHFFSGLAYWATEIIRVISTPPYRTAFHVLAALVVASYITHAYHAGLSLFLPVLAMMLFFGGASILRLAVEATFAFFYILAAVLVQLYDGGLALTALSHQITAESTPPGAWNVYLVASQEIGLNHSTHSDPAALQILRSWLTNYSHK